MMPCHVYYSFYKHHPSLFPSRYTSMSLCTGRMRSSFQTITNPQPHPLSRTLAVSNRSPASSSITKVSATPPFRRFLLTLEDMYIYIYSHAHTHTRSHTRVPPCHRQALTPLALYIPIDAPASEPGPSRSTWSMEQLFFRSPAPGLLSCSSSGAASAEKAIEGDILGDKS